MLRIILLTLSLALSAPQVSAEEYDYAVSAYRRGDYLTALKTFRKLAEQGNTNGQNGLGVMYKKGRGVLQDYAEAVRWYRLAADQGHAGAQRNLGFMYEDGKGVPQDYAEAVRWYRLAAEQGNSVAQFSLAIMYKKGRGFPKNNIMAHMWYNLASVNGTEKAGEWRDELAAKMTAKELAKAQALARECMKSDYKDCGD